MPQAWGTAIGLFVLAVLKNGLQLAALPTELTGVLTGVLLIASIALDAGRRRVAGARPADVDSGEEFTVKNIQVAVVCATVLAAALIVAGSNVWLVRSLTDSRSADAAAKPTPGRSRPVIAMMP